MPKLEEILKSQGYTDEDLAANATLLNDPKFRSALETQYNVLDSERTTLKEKLDRYTTENEGWVKWQNEYANPTLELYAKERTEALAENASLKERLRIAEEQGFAPRREPATTTAAAAAAMTTASADTFDPKKHNLVTMDDVKTLADAEGQAIAMSANLLEEYRYLTGGKSLFDYTYQTKDGRNLSGMVALRQESMDNKAPNLYDYASRKFDFAGKRAAIAEAQQKAHEEAIRKDERTKVMGEVMNPNTRQWQPSTQPFIPKSPAQNGKQPWEIPAQERRNARLTTIMERAQQAS